MKRLISNTTEACRAGTRGQITQRRIVVGVAIALLVVLGATGALPIQFGVPLSEDGPTVSIESIDTDERVQAGEEFSVEVVLENTGNESVNETIEVAVGALGSQTQSVNVSAGDTATATFTFDTSGADPADYTIDVASNEDSTEATVEVTGTGETETPTETATQTGSQTPTPTPSPADVSVTVVETASPIIEGRTLTVRANITNDGGTDWDGTISLENFDGDVVDSTQRTIPAETTQQVELTWDTEEGDNGADSVVVRAGDDASDDQLVDIRPGGEGNFAVRIERISEPVAGETLEITVNIENTGQRFAGRTIEIDAGDLGSKETDFITLDSGESREATIEFPTAEGDSDTYDITVSSDDDTATGTARVRPPPEGSSVEISEVSPGQPVEGRQLSVAVTVQNTGDDTTSPTVGVNVGGLGFDSRDAGSIDPGDESKVTLSIPTNPGDAGTYTLTATAGAAQQERSVTVRQDDTEFDVRIDSIPEQVTVGETISVSATVTNTGNVSGSQDITFSIDGGTTGLSETVSLGPDESTSVSFSYTTSESDTPAVSVGVASDDSSAGGSVTVTEPANFTVAIDSIPESVTVGDKITVEATVTNTGGVSGSQPVRFSVGGDIQRETDVSLDSGADTSVSFSYTTSETGTVSVGVAIGDSSAGGSVTVEEPPTPTFTVAIDSIPAQVEVGQSFTVEATVTNTGGASGSQSVTFSVDGELRDSSEVSLGSGADTSVSFGYATSESDTPAVSVVVATANSSKSASVDVRDRDPNATTFDVAIDSIAGTPTPTDAVTPGPDSLPVTPHSDAVALDASAHRSLDPLEGHREYGAVDRSDARAPAPRVRDRPRNR